MPREFKDLSAEVSTGSKKIEQSLNEVRAAADEADKAHAKLNESQQKSARMASEFAKAMGEASGDLAKFTEGVKGHVSSLSSMETVTKGAVKGLTELQSASAVKLSCDISGVENGAKKAAQVISGTTATISPQIVTPNVSKIVKVVSTAAKAASGSLASIGGGKAKDTISAFKMISTEIERLENEIKKLEKSKGTLQFDPAVLGSTQTLIEKYKIVKDYMKWEASEGLKANFQKIAQNKSLAEAVDMVGQKEKEVGEDMREGANRTAMKFGALSQEQERLAKVMRGMQKKGIVGEEKYIPWQSNQR